MNLQRKEMLDAVIKKNGLGALVFWRPDELVLAIEYQPFWGLSFLIYTNDGRKQLSLFWEHDASGENKFDRTTFAIDTKSKYAQYHKTEF